MSHIVDEEAYVTWLDRFMPPVSSPEFLPLATPVELHESHLPESLAKATSRPAARTAAEETEKAETESEEEEQAKLVGARSHLIGLSFYRAAALNQIAAALPENDTRKQVYRKLAAVHGQKGFETMYEADYAGTHWMASYAVYMLTAGE